MAKTGVAYFHMDTDRYADKRIKKLLRNHGCAGLAVYDYIVCECFRVKGWGIEWDEDAIFDVADALRVKESMVEEVVIYCAFVGLFDKELHRRGMLTSAEIQEKYLDMCCRSKRLSAYIPSEYSIITEENTEETKKTTEEKENLPTFCEKDGVLPLKEKKIKENKRKESECDAHTPAPSQVQKITLFDKFRAWCLHNAPLSLNFAEPMTEEQFKWLHATYGANRMQKVATELHNKSAYKQCRNAFYTWRDWLDKMR